MDTNAVFNTYSNIVEDWNGGYKLEFDLTSRTSIDGWEVKFDLPYKITGDYGVDVVEHSDGTYTIKGEDGWANLDEGQSIEAILIIEDYGQEALPLDFHTSSSGSSFSSSSSQSVIGDESQNIAVSSSTAVSTSDSNDAVTNIDTFGGDLAEAIASANDGDTIQLNAQTYYTYGITIDKDITLVGQEGTVIDGMGTSNSIVEINSSASGATIQSVDITNGNNGIYSNGASDLTLQDLDVYNIGNSERISGGQNNTGIILNYATDAKLINSRVSDVSRNGVSIGDTDGATISGLTVEDINLAALHSQSHDAAGIKLFNTNDVVVSNNRLKNINANNIWNDTTNKTIIENNTIENVGSAFAKPSFNDNVDISGIYNEKSSNSVVRYNYASSVDDFAAYNATEFTTESMSLEDNNFSIVEINTEDYWVNESAEKLIAITEDPAEADFGLFSDEYLEVVVTD